MAINTRIVNGSHTEIYVGGGNFITQAAPTNFHRFWSSKILAVDESADLFVEVTAARRAQLEQSDDAWVRPPQCFIDQWNATAGEYGCYNEATGFFELNGINGIPYAEAMEIYSCSAHVALSHTNSISAARAIIGNAPCRTLLPLRLLTSSANLSEFYSGCKAEIIRVTYGQTLWTSSLYAAFNDCTKLRRIENDIYCSVNSFVMAFRHCYALEYLHLGSLSYSLDLSDCSKLSLDSISFLIANRSGSSAITITLHPDAYARVTDDIFAAAAAKNITIATP